MRHGSRMANRMLQYLAADTLAHWGGGAPITGTDIPEWQIAGSKCLPGHRAAPKIDVLRVDVPWLHARITDGTLHRVKINTAVCDVDLLPDRSRANALFDARGSDYYRTGPEDLVIHVRLEDIMQPGRHPDYGPLPIAWYREVLEDTGLRPVFVGQFSTDAYSDALKAAFPEAVILEGGSVLHDFETIRHAHNVALGVSTFSWMAAWLGATGRIFQPMLGLLNPEQQPGINLTPRGDDRYHFYKFPLRQWNADATMIEAVISGPSDARKIDGAEVVALLDQARLDYEPDLAQWRGNVLQAAAAQRPAPA